MCLLSMDTKQHKVTACVWLKPIWHTDLPVISINFGPEEIYHGELSHDQMFLIDRIVDTGSSWLSVILHNKRPSDTIVEKNLDKAVVIDRVAFNGIESPDFVWQGLYTPDYHLEWYQQQISQGATPDKILKYHNYLGWNGEWRLTFSVPIFTWIHRVQNLGWIYD
jgi:hypothetical protein